AVGVANYPPPVPLAPTDLLRFAARHDIRYVQFGDNMPLHDLTEDELNQLADTASDLHIHIQTGTRRLTVENISRYLLIAEKLKSAFLRVVIDDEDFHPDEHQVIEAIRTLVPVLEKKRIRLAIENHDRFPATALVNIIEQTNPQLVGICLDTANSIGANEGVNEVVRVLGPYTINLHVKDITIKRLPHKMGFNIEGCAAGKGVLNIPQVIGQLKHYNHCDTATLEVWSSPEPTIEESIAKEKRWVEASIHYLKTILS
ncbi:MAG: sugar phosphate isomerase/epimerase, partial [Proteobacteria bacterium]